MRIVILGSWKTEKKEKWKLLGDEREFKNACRLLGEQLIRVGHTIIAGSTSERTADFNFVQGAIEAYKMLQLQRYVIEVLRPANEGEPYKEWANQYPNAFRYHDFPEDRWPVAHLLALLESDSVLVIGGADSSYHASLAGLVARKPIIPVASFGGAASRVSREVEARPYPLFIGRTEWIGQLRVPWSDQHVPHVLGILSHLNSPKILLIHGRSQDWRIVKNFLQNQLSLEEPIVMGEAFGQGRALPEKFEQLAFPVRGAIAIATPDDRGIAVVDSNSAPVAETQMNHRSRARQNVWLECGWFWGALGRDRLLLLTKGEVEIPSDLDGVEHYRYINTPMEVFEQVRQFVNHLQKY